MGTRRAYPPEFRRQIIELVRSGRRPEELASEFEPSAQSIRNWVAQADRDEGRRADGLTSAERAELSQLAPRRGVDFRSAPGGSGSLHHRWGGRGFCQRKKEKGLG